MSPGAAGAPSGSVGGQGLWAIAVAALVFAVIYRAGTLVARSRGQRHFRQMLVLYQAAGPAQRRGWLLQVTLAPTLTALARGRVAVAHRVSRIPRWANRSLLGSQMGAGSQDLMLIRLGGIAVAAVAGLVTNGNLGVIAGGLVVGTVVPILLARRRNRRRHLLFARQLPQVLTVMITALRAGRSLAQTVDVISEQVAQPASAEFLLVAQKRRLGVDLSVALKELSERLDNADVQLLVNALVVQRETGGNLVPILETIYATVRERLAFQGEIRTMTAQVRMTARIITALPFGMFGMVYLLNPTGVSFFWTKWPIGPAMLGGALVLIVFGQLIMRRLVVVK